MIHFYNNINILNIKNIIVKYENNIINLPILYTDKLSYNIINEQILQHKLNNDSNNHFYFNSFNVNKNSKNIKNELMRLFINRDKYKNIHFHLDGNGGGDIVLAHLILRCLVGEKKKWMKNIKKVLKDGTIFEWDCWNEENINSPNYKTVLKLNLDFIPKYDIVYNGKIYLYMHDVNGSAAWFFITYLIYAFGNNIIRFNKKCYGKILKFGMVNSDKLILKGISSTTSGDGNAIPVKYKNIEIYCPTEQFISCSIKKYDWNRFWIENKNILN
jgi:hypothetical protein